MAQSKDGDTLSSELESRLDDLFGENDIPLPDTQDRNVTDHYPLAELKNLILSIDWEITDEVLENFLQQLQDLKLMYKQDKIVSTFLQILNSLGDYIKTNRAKSHPKTFKTLNSVFSTLDKVVLSKDMEETAKKKMLLAEMHRYKELRAHISQSKSAQQRQAKTAAVKTEKSIIKLKEEAPGTGSTAPPLQPSDTADDRLTETVQRKGTSDIPPQEPFVADLAEAVREIKRYIHAEIKALKEEINALLDQQE